MISSDAWDVVILGSGVAGLAGALAAHELGLRPLVLEKASTLGGGTVHSYGLIWVGQNHLAQAAGHGDTRDETIAYLRYLGGASLGDVAAVRGHVNALRTELVARLDLYREIQKRQFPRPDALSGPALHQYLVLRGGIRAEENTIDWLDEIKAVL